MDHRDILGGIFSSGGFLADHEICSTRRGLLAAPLLAALSDKAARAGTINPSETGGYASRRDQVGAAG
jgi:hypothetical protein